MTRNPEEGEERDTWMYVKRDAERPRPRERGKNLWTRKAPKRGGKATKDSGEVVFDARREASGECLESSCDEETRQSLDAVW
jgi:hypothetical protein